MKQEDKELLLKDLSARLIYGVKIHIGKTQRIEVFDEVNLCIGAINNTYADVKPYLFPLSSMSEEQEKEWRYTLSSDGSITYETVDWLNKNHFDYRNLIPMGLALDATGLTIY